MEKEERAGEGGRPAALRRGERGGEERREAPVKEVEREGGVRLPILPALS